MIATLLVPWLRARLSSDRARHRKSVEMLFAHLKTHLAAWAASVCAAHAVRKMKFTLAAIAQNLRRLAKLVARPPPAADAMSCLGDVMCQCRLIQRHRSQRADGENRPRDRGSSLAAINRRLLQHNLPQADSCTATNRSSFDHLVGAATERQTACGRGALTEKQCLRPLSPTREKICARRPG